ncbi:hypothetical protein RFI_30430 [Reticulomyxa filosa]|uniref:Zinc finger PHD-type domain-containing protein n=1 Tax=Reticulomyxa filosa TaxID=46433 RepID=X6M0N5_RETFI|nr:hypothetical protein RFI_30430 [Reticulomyxa filosa]|eukprot:ETO06962.1 hypothetical protein RFI_30430 [Reticulomyxa filosa]
MKQYFSEFRILINHKMKFEDARRHYMAEVSIDDPKMKCLTEERFCFCRAHYFNKRDNDMTNEQQYLGSALQSGLMSTQDTKPTLLRDLLCCHLCQEWFHEDCALGQLDAFPMSRKKREFKCSRCHFLQGITKVSIDNPKNVPFEWRPMPISVPLLKKMCDELKSSLILVSPELTALTKLLSLVRKYQHFAREFLSLIDGSLNSSQIAVMQYLIDVGEISGILTPELCAMKCWMSCHKSNNGFQEENIRALSMYELPEEIFSFIKLKDGDKHSSDNVDKQEDILYVPTRNCFLQMWSQLTFIRTLGYHYAYVFFFFFEVKTFNDGNRYTTITTTLYYIFFFFFRSQMRRKTKTPKMVRKILHSLDFVYKRDMLQIEEEEFKKRCHVFETESERKTNAAVLDEEWMEYVNKSTKIKKAEKSSFQPKYQAKIEAFLDHIVEAQKSCPIKILSLWSAVSLLKALKEG